METKKRYILLGILFCLLIPIGVGAAVMYLEPSSGEYQPGETFLIGVKIDTQGECVNAVETNLSFSKNLLEGVDFSRGPSLISLWIKVPEIHQESGLISFIGGIPGGYCGIIPGDPGESNILGKIIFRIPEMIGEPEENKATVEFLDTSQVLLNDGLGTKAELITRGAVFEILSGLAEPPKDEWKEELEEDSIAPEVFDIEISQDPSLFEGKYFAVFSTTDKQTGLDYFELKEGKRGWKRVESPYLLEDQKLQSIIKVRAVDKAGNERLAEYLPEISPKPFPYWIIVLVLLGAGVIWWIIKRLRNK